MIKYQYSRSMSIKASLANTWQSLMWSLPGEYEVPGQHARHTRDLLLLVHPDVGGDVRLEVERDLPGHPAMQTMRRLGRQITVIITLWGLKEGLCCAPPSGWRDKMPGMITMVNNSWQGVVNNSKLTVRDCAVIPEWTSCPAWCFSSCRTRAPCCKLYYYYSIINYYITVLLSRRAL